jgi:hypothetical protein
MWHRMVGSVLAPLVQLAGCVLLLLQLLRAARSCERVFEVLRGWGGAGSSESILRDYTGGGVWGVGGVVHACVS